MHCNWNALVFFNEIFKRNKTFVRTFFNGDLTSTWEFVSFVSLSTTEGLDEPAQLRRPVVPLDASASMCFKAA